MIKGKAARLCFAQRVMKYLWITLGTLAVFAALLGIFLPLLPTTPFLLLASACYVRGSERLHRKLRENRVFGRYLRDFEDQRAIPLRAKVVAITMLWLSLLISASMVQAWGLKIMLTAIGLGVTVYLLRLKTIRRTPTDESCASFPHRTP
jgi:uncharacterized membrane protein YbaN (DUF454 family)